ncbi:MAG: hypothetical protein IM600_14565 [Bacteroidetes bacterium]|nr:hypothetical protein [Bacteroidota bacterium]MCA6444653.1 hypothetical protein [Bacteroidota bacterium]
MKNLICLSLVVFALLISCTKDLVVKDIKNKSIAINAPSDNFNTTGNSITFWWEPLEGAEKYNLQIVKPNFNSITQLVLDTEIVSNKFNKTLLPGVYQWRIKAINGGGSTAFQTFSFKIDTTSNLTNQIVSTIAPSTGFLTGNSKIAFSWNSLNSALQYQLVLLNASNGIIKDTTTSNTTYTYTFPAQGAFSWKLRALNNTSISQYNASQTFTIDLTPPAPSTPTAPTAFFPAHGFTSATPTTVLGWIRTGAPDARYDSIIVAVDSTFLNVISSTRTYQLNTTIGALNNSSAIISNSNYYFWRIISVDSVRNKSVPSPFRKFKML